MKDILKMAEEAGFHWFCSGPKGAYYKAHEADIQSFATLLRAEDQAEIARLQSVVAFQEYCLQIQQNSIAELEAVQPSALKEKLRKRITQLEQEARGVTTCPTCGTHEIENSVMCHNSACSAYARSVTVRQGWLSAAPKPPEAATGEPPAREPLTETQWMDGWAACQRAQRTFYSTELFEAAVRFAEKHHGIEGRKG